MIHLELRDGVDVLTVASDHLDDAGTIRWGQAGGAMKRGKRHQVAVLAVSTQKPGQILLVTSRTSRSWSLAKGNVDQGLEPVEAARKEAFEEAGIRGRMASEPVGSYIHRKTVGGKYRVKVFKMHVRKQLSTWPEKKERKRRWVPVKLALKLISNPSLKQLIKAQF
jgi:8-oxo-dGTP pyrophosphatase MutT (NUDIX family)